MLDGIDNMAIRINTVLNAFFRKENQFSVKDKRDLDFLETLLAGITGVLLPDKYNQLIIVKLDNDGSQDFQQRLTKTNADILQ